jgi:apolipoprotein N-acyltransferase
MSTLINKILLSAISGFALSLVFLAHEYFIIAWVAFIPLLWAMRGASYKQVYFLSLLAGFTAFALAKYWIIDFILLSKGGTDLVSLTLALLYWIYCAHLLVFAMLSVTYLERKGKVAIVFVFPLVITAFIAAYPLLFTMHLGETQVYFTSALQTIEFTGVHGLNFIIALCNALIFQFLSAIVEKRGHRSYKSYGVAITTLLAWFTYGLYATAYWEEKLEQWPLLTVGMVQPNEIPSVGRKAVELGYSQSYPPEMAMSESLVATSSKNKNTLDLIVWPEAQYKGYLDNSALARGFNNTIAELKTPLLFQDFENTGDQQFNSAIFIDENGNTSSVYRKIKRIPFGEYLPFRSYNKAGREKANTYFTTLFTEKLFDTGFLNELTAGDTFVAINHPKATLIPLICYETTFPDFVANAVSASTDSKGMILVALSNDGWFGSTHQPRQHVIVSALRAIENRTPLIHVANNGPSIVVSPRGDILFESDFQKAGGYIAQLPYSLETKSSFYSRHPLWFVYLVYALLAISIALPRKT